MKKPLALILLGIIAVAAGCNEKREIPTDEINAKFAEARAEKEQGDYFLQEKYFARAETHYKQAVQYANQAMGYDETNQEVKDFLAATWAILRGEAMTEGIKGKIEIDGEWVMPEVYLKRGLAEIEQTPAITASLESNWATLADDDGARRNPVASSAGNAILAFGRKALPFLAEKIETAYFRAVAARLAFALPERDEMMVCLLLKSLKHVKEDVVMAAVEAATNFNDKYVVVALLEKVAENRAPVTEAAIKSTIRLNTDLGQRILAEMLFANPGNLQIKSHILANLYLVEDIRTIDLLVNFINRSDSELMIAAARSLLMMHSDKVLPALGNILKNYESFRRSSVDRTDLLLEIIERLGRAKYAPAAETLRAIYLSDVFLIDKAPRRAAIAALNSIADNDENALDILLDLLMCNYAKPDPGKDPQIDEDKDDWKDIAAYVVGHKSPQVIDTLITTMKDCDRETAEKIVYTLGRCGNDAAIEPMAGIFKQYLQRRGNHSLLPMILEALIAIGSQKSIDKMFELAVLVTDYYNKNNSAANLADNIRSGETAERTYEILFGHLRTSEIYFALAILASFEHYAPPAAASHIRALADDAQAPLEIRLGATSALIPYLDDPDEFVDAKTVQTIKDIVDELANTPNQHLYFVAQKYLRRFKSTQLTQFYMDLLADPGNGNWKLHSLAAECLLARKGEVAMEPYTKSIEVLRERYVEQGDFLTAVKLAEFAKDSYAVKNAIYEQFVERIKKTFGGSQRPLDKALLSTLADISEILGKEYRTLAPSPDDPNAQTVAEAYKFAYFPDCSILIMYNNTDKVKDPLKAAQSQVVKAVAYLPGCKFDFHGIKNGDVVGTITPLLKNIDQISYVLQYHAYVLDINFAEISNVPGAENKIDLGDVAKLPDRKMIFITEKNDKDREIIKYAAESLTDKLDVRIADLMTLFDIAERIIAEPQPRP